LFVFQLRFLPARAFGHIDVNLRVVDSFFEANRLYGQISEANILEPSVNRLALYASRQNVRDNV
jgi:hypothetical protein